MKEILEHPAGMTYCSLEYILEHIEDFRFGEISIDTFYRAVIDNEMTIVNLVDENEPVGIGNSKINNYGSILIDKNYYLNNREYVDQMICKIVSKMNSNVRITGIDLINNNLIDTLSKNENLNYISLQGAEGESYSLSKEVYEKLKQNKAIVDIKSTTVDDDLKETFDPIINYSKRNLIKSKDYYDLQKTDKLNITEPFSEEELNNIKYINPNCEIVFELNNYTNTIEAIKKLDELGFNNNITFRVKNKNAFNNMVFRDSGYFLEKNINVYTDLNTYDIKTYISYEKRLMDMVKPALNLSPLERFLYAYNVVKNYKEYKENDEDLFSSRSLYDILDNDYMVCVGYSKLLVDLLSKLGISAKDLSSSVAVGMERIPNKDIVADETSYTRVGHARVQVKIVDEKYGIDGVYISDPTWDNVLGKDYYNNALLTAKENNSKNRENYITYMNINEILDSENIEEFYKRVNYSLDVQEKKRKKNDLDSINRLYLTNKEKLEEMEIFTERQVIKCILVSLKKQFHYGDYNYYIGEKDKDSFIKDLFNSAVFSIKYYNIKTEEELQKEIDKKVSYNYNNRNKKDNYVISTLVNKLLEYVEKFNPSLYESIYNQFPGLNFAKGLNDEEYYKIIEKIGNYVLSVNNNIISGKTIMDGVKEVYISSGMSEEEASKKLEETIEDNKIRQETQFPKRVRINQDDTEEVYINKENKFDFSEGRVF